MAFDIGVKILDVLPAFMLCPIVCVLVASGLEMRHQVTPHRADDEVSLRPGLQRV